MSNRTIAGHVATTVIALFFMGAPAAAQQQLSSVSETSVAALTVVGLTTIQPADNTYVGASGPYLDRGLGGIGFGAAAGLNVLTPSRFAATLEVSTASVSASQRGRLVGGSAEGTLRDTLVSMLAGISTNSRAALLQAGVSWLVATPRLNDVDVDDPEARHLAFTAGFDGAHPVGARTAVVANVRYSIVPRTTRIVQIGVGRQIVRAGVGVRVRLD
jgi:hypothetical protein